MACGSSASDSWRLCAHTQPRHPRPHSLLLANVSRDVLPFLALFAVLCSSQYCVVLAQPNASTSMETSSVSPSSSSPPPALTNDTAALLASSDLTALFYRHYNAGVIVAPLVVADATQLPREVTSRIASYELQFDQLDGFLQRALLWDAGYVYIPPSTTSTNTSSTKSPSLKNPFLKIYTRDGVDMANIAPTRSEMEKAGCALQLCTSEFGKTWRTVTCGDSSAILSVVHCAIDTSDSASAVASNTSDGRARALWTAWNAEDRSSADRDALNKADLAAPDVNVAGAMYASGESRPMVLTIHTVPFGDEPAIGQCPASRTDNRGDLLPTLTIPCAAYDAVVKVKASSASRSLVESPGGSGEWKQPQTSQLLSSWLQSVAPKSVAATKSPTPGGSPKPPPPSNTPNSNNNNGNNNNNNNNGNNANGAVLPSAPGSTNNSRQASSDGTFNLLNLIPIIVGALAVVAILFGFVLVRKRRNSRRESARRGASPDGRDGCSPYANSSMFKTEDAYIDATSFLSPAAAVGSGRKGDFTASGRSNPPHAVGDLDNEIHSSNNSAVSLETVRASSDRRRSIPKSLVMATLRRVISEPSSNNPVSRPSLDTEHLKLLQTDPNLSASRLSYDKIVFERVVSRSPRYEVWLSQYEGEEIAVKRLVQRANNDSLLALDNELSLAGAAAAMASDDRMAMALEAFVAEIQITASLDHPNLARFVGVAWARLPADSLCLVTEYQSNGDLRSYIQKHKEKLTWPRHKLKWAKGIANGLRYLHNQRPIVLHLELNSTHVLLSDRLKPKLIDFGERLTADDWTQLRISGEESRLSPNEFPYWAAPEVLRGDGHLMASDVYSFGMLLLELDACKVPFHASKNTSNGSKLKPFQMMNMVIQGRLKPIMADSCPVEIREIIERCTDVVPGSRPKMPEVVRMLELADYEMVL